MEAWVIGIIAVVVLGLAAIAYGGIADRRKHRRAVQEMLSPPPRSIPHLDPDAAQPRYLTRAQARQPPPGGGRPELDTAERDRISTELRDRSTVSLKIGYASDGFVTDTGTGRAVLDEPRVLVSAEPVMNIRELISVIEHMMTDGSPLVVVAPTFADVVLDTLEVNHIRQQIDLLAVVTRDPVLVDRITAATGAQLVSRIDLQTGYLADRDLGRCRRWVSDHRRSHIIDGATAAGDHDHDESAAVDRGEPDGASGRPEPE